MSFLSDEEQELPSSSLSNKKSQYWNLKQYSNERSSQINSSFFKIRRIKVYLMSRNIHKQVKALQVMMGLLKDKGHDVYMKMLIQTDVPGLLCDLMNNHNPSLISKVIVCLTVLSQSNQFYDHKHSAIVVETTCRTLKILSNNVKNIKVIYYGLKLLSQIFSRSRPKSATGVRQVLGLIKDLSTLMYRKIHLNVFTLLPYVLSVEVQQSLDVLRMVYRALYLLTQLEKHNQRKFKKNIIMVIDIILLSSSHLKNCEDAYLQDSITKFAWRIVVRAVIPSIRGVSKKNLPAEMMQRHIQCVSKMYCLMDREKLVLLSNKLATDGFLTLLPTLSLQYNDETLHQCVMSLLTQLVSTLTVSCLNPTESELQLINDHLPSLSADICKWPQYLVNTKAHKVHLPIIVYLYFVLATSQSFEKFQTLEPVLSHFLKSQTSPPSPTLLKAIWLVFAVSCLTVNKAAKSRKPVVSSSGLLVRWINAATLSDIYTHHPALLLWAFNPYVSAKILQINLMMMWLKDNNKTSLYEMEHLVLRNRKAAVCLLDVLSCCSADVLPNCVRIIQKVLAREKKEGHLELSDYLWSNLSRTLSMMTIPQPRPGTTVKNVILMVFLACKVVPAAPDKVMLIRISYQLLTLLRLPITDISAAQMLHAQLFKLASTLVVKMNQLKDYRVLEVFLQDSVMLRTLMQSLDSDNESLTLPALGLLSYLLSCHHMLNIQVDKESSITGETLLRLMYSNKGTNLLATLHLFKLLRVTENITPIVVFSPNTADHMIQSLYFQFQNLTFKVNDSWRCQTLLIEFCAINNPRMELHLLTTPWTHLAVQLAFKRNSMNDAEVLNFLVVWLTRLVDRKVVRKVNYSRALCQDRMSKTLTNIAREVLKCHQLNSMFLNQHIKIASKIQEIGANVSSEVLHVLEDQILSRNFIL